MERVQMKKYCSILLLGLMLAVPGFLTASAPAAVPAATQTVTQTAAQEAAPQTAVISAAPQTAPAPKAESTPKNRFSGTFWALVPPVLAILLALITKEVFSSLFIGILCGSCLAAEFSPLKTLDILIGKGLIDAVKDSGGIFIFLVTLGALVALLNRTGAAAFGQWAREHVRSKRGAGLMTFLLGILIFIDDYFNCLTVGGVMRPVTDAKGVSRAKLAYLIDATAAPVCMIAPISSWAAAVSQYADGTGYSGLELFIRAIPYNFYSLLTLLFVLTLLMLNFDFGPMARQEKMMLKNNDTPADQSENANAPTGKGKICDLLIPLVCLIVVCVFALVYVGGILEGKSFIAAFSDTDATIALPLGGVAVFALSIFYLQLRKVISFRDAMECLPRGFSVMVQAILILTLATALKNMTNMLEGREFIAGQLSGSAPELAQFLPAVIFAVATFLAFSTGTSWGTFGILIPIVVSIFPSTSPLLYIGMSACLAGAVCGDHCSPISDTTIMSSAGAECDHLTHVSTQLPYALFVAGISFLGFLLAGIVQNWFIVFPAVALIMIAGICLLKYFRKKADISAQIS